MRLHQGAPAPGAPGGHLHGQRASGVRRRERARVLKAVPLRQAGRACASPALSANSVHYLLSRTSSQVTQHGTMLPGCASCITCCTQGVQGLPPATRQAVPAVACRTGAGAHRPREAARGRRAAAGPQRAPAGRSRRRRRRCRRPPRPPHPFPLPPPAGPRPPAPRPVTVNAGMQGASGRSEQSGQGALHREPMSSSTVCPPLPQGS